MPYISREKRMDPLTLEGLSWAVANALDDFVLHPMRDDGIFYENIRRMCYRYLEQHCLTLGSSINVLGTLTLVDLEAERRIKPTDRLETARRILHRIRAGIFEWTAAPHLELEKERQGDVFSVGIVKDRKP